MFVLGVETNVWQLPKPLFHAAKQTSCVGLSGRTSLQNKSAGKLNFCHQKDQKVAFRQETKVSEKPLFPTKNSTQTPSEPI